MMASPAHYIVLVLRSAPSARGFETLCSVQEATPEGIAAFSGEIARVKERMGDLESAMRDEASGGGEPCA